MSTKHSTEDNHGARLEGAKRKMTRAVNLCANKAMLATILRVSERTVRRWGQCLPLVRQYQLEIVTNGVFRAQRRAR